MAEFALVHGAWHGAWCWERTIAELGARGHRAIAMDLPSDRLDATLDDYAAAVIDAMHVLGDAPIVVGHSFGGFTIPVVADRRAVSRLVFLAAFVPQLGRTPGETMADDRCTARGFRSELLDDGRTLPAPEMASHFMTHDVRAGDALHARLRPQAWTATELPYPLAHWPAVASSYIVCSGDRLLLPECQRRLARDRLGVEPLELPGGHEPMLARAGELAAVLAALA